MNVSGITYNHILKKISTVGSKSVYLVRQFFLAVR